MTKRIPIPIEQTSEITSSSIRYQIRAHAKRLTIKSQEHIQGLTNREYGEILDGCYDAFIKGLEKKSAKIKFKPFISYNLS